MPEREFTVIDNLRGDEPKVTERAGVIRPGPSGILKTRNKDLADELKQRYPHLRVVEHELQTGGQATKQMWTMPELPWKRKDSEDGSESKE